MEHEKKGNVHQEPGKKGTRQGEKNINTDPKKQGGHEKEHESTERRPNK